MAKYTENYNLEKPEKTEHYDIETANKNNDILDARLFEKQDKQAGKGLSTNDFTDEYKKKIDALQRIYKYCGSVEVIADLDTIEERQIGDVYNVKDTNIDYCWNGTEWTELGNAVDLTNYQTKEEANQDKQEIQDNLVIVSSTEPTGDNREKVWIKKGKNLLNKADVAIGKFFAANSTDEELDTTSNALTTAWIPCLPNTTYIISGGNDRNRWQTKAQDGTITYMGDSSRSLKTNSTAKYLRCYYYASYSGALPDVQIEQGTTTAYEEYIQPEIYVLNNNDVYEKVM